MEALTVSEEIRSRLTYSALLPRVSPEATEQFILGQLDRAGLGHNTFTPEALALVVRSGEGLLPITPNHAKSRFKILAPNCNCPSQPCQPAQIG